MRDRKDACWCGCVLRVQCSEKRNDKTSHAHVAAESHLFPSLYFALSKERELQRVLSYVAAPAVHLEPGRPAPSTRRCKYIPGTYRYSYGGKDSKADG